MATPELIEKWKRIEDALRSAIFYIPNKAHQDVERALEYLDHNELGIAYDFLRDYAQETNFQNRQFQSYLAFAAKEMEIEL